MYDVRRFWLALFAVWACLAGCGEGEGEPGVRPAGFIGNDYRTSTPAPRPFQATPTRIPRVPIAEPPRANCDPSYPDVCIPPYPPDLDCGDIPFRRFRVVGADPHGFDRDRDGIGCESG